MAAPNALRLGLGLTPFALIGVTLVAFALTRDPTVFALAGILAAIYVLAFFLVLRRRRKGATLRAVSQNKGRGRRARR